VIDCVVAPVDHDHDGAALAVSVTLPPGQSVVGPDAVIAGVAAALAVTTVAAEVMLQPVCVLRAVNE
jgi:hypothetical protein